MSVFQIMGLTKHTLFHPLFMLLGLDKLKVDTPVLFYLTFLPSNTSDFDKTFNCLESVEAIFHAANNPI